MSTHDSSPPNRPAKRLVLRKIAPPADARSVVARPVSSVARPVSPTVGATPSVPARPWPRASVAPPANFHTAPTLPPPAPTLPPTPFAQSTYGSVPPVVANISTPLFAVRDVVRAAPPSSSWRGVVGGAVIGLAIVGALIVGTRLAWSPARSAAASGPVVPAAMTATPPPTSAPPAPVPSDVPAAEETPGSTAAPVVAATALPVVTPPPRVSLPPPVARVRPAEAIAPKATTVAPAAAPPKAAAASSDSAPEENAPSLVPVIPSSAPADADPLVKAVQHDIDEDQKSHGAK